MPVVARRRPITLRTERLGIRMLAREHVTEFTRYRNLEATSRYQDWPLPYTRDHAHQLIDDLEQLDGPTAGEWVQLAIERDRTFVGDIAIWLDDAATFATIGYTLAPEHQGRGYAVEAVAAVTAHLFVDRKVHRIAATLDPRNLASARVLERNGYRFVGVARSAALVRGEWTDDARFSLLRDEWDAWRRRPTRPPKLVSLAEIEPGTVRDVGRIDRAFSQRGLVASVYESLAEALIPPLDDTGQPLLPWFRVIVADGAQAGFVMIAAPSEFDPDPYLWRLVIDVAHQGRGIGRRAVVGVADEWRAQGATRLFVSYVTDEVGSPERFYRSLGFVPTGEIDDGETVAVLDLTR